MVYYYKTKDNHIMYMGKDKHENEDLIEYSWKEDVWFHVDNVSSAHVYLRLNKEENIKNISEEVLEECCQLVRFNSIEGSKKKLVDVVYTMASNLLKTQNMEVGAVGFKKNNEKYLKRNIVKGKDIYKTICKTEKEKYPDLKQELINRENEDILKRKNEYEIEKINKKIKDKKIFEEKEQFNKDLLQFKPIQNDECEINNSEDEDDFL